MSVTNISASSKGANYARLTELRNVRYGEILLLKKDDEGFVAEVWNTMGFNDCPPEQFNAINAQKVAEENDAFVAFMNGPRFWTFDALEAGMRATAPTKTFGELTMFLAATVRFGDTPPDRIDYTDRFVHRDNFWEFAAHQPRHYLVTPDGQRCILQAYAHYVDPTQTLDTLHELGGRLNLPEGWTFESDMDPQTTLQLGTGEENVACILQDELGNSYQRMIHFVELEA